MLGPFTDIHGDLYYTNDSNAFGIANNFKYEELDREYLAEVIMPGDIFIDIGAAHGFWSICAAKLGAYVYSIEASKYNCEILSKNYLLNNLSGHILEGALVADLHTKTLFCGDILGDAWLARDRDSAKDCFQVHTFTVQELLESHSIPSSNVKFIKMDIEGYEPYILFNEYFKTIIDNSPELQIIMEFCETDINQYHVGGREVISKILVEYGFKVYYPDHHKYYHQGIKNIVPILKYEDLVEAMSHNEFHPSGSPIGSILLKRK